MTTELKIMIAIGVFTLSLFAGGVWWMSKVQNPANVMVASETLIPADAASLGPTDAPLIIVEFGDYQCPSCSSAHPAIKALLAEHPNQIRFVFRHFPLMQHPYAVVAAQAAEAAGAQGKYWEMHNWLYEHQNEWSASSNPQPLFSTAATSLGLNVTTFDQAMQAKTATNKIQQGLADGTNIGVDATPTFYLNGRKFSGSMADLKAAVEKNLSNLAPPKAS